jgi:hypothetical protein
VANAVLHILQLALQKSLTSVPYANQEDMRKFQQKQIKNNSST